MDMLRVSTINASGDITHIQEMTRLKARLLWASIARHDGQPADVAQDEASQAIREIFEEETCADEIYSSRADEITLFESI